MSLTEKQRLFVRAYLIEPNGKKAAIAAGYSPNGAEVQASKMLRLPKVIEALAEARRAVAAVSGVTPEWVMSQLYEMASLDIRNIVRWQSNAVAVAEDPKTGLPVLTIENRVELVDSDGLSAAAAAAVSEVAQSKSGLKVKKHDKLAVLRTIAQILGMFPAGAAKAPSKTAQPPAADAPPPAQADDGWGQLLN